MFDLSKLLAEKYTTLYRQENGGAVLVVKETAQYRWFEYAGESVQSLMKRASPEQIIMPIYQSLLLFLLWNNRPLTVLNLGLGGASIERRLASVPNISVTSVDASQTIIDIAKHYFNLPKVGEVVCQGAEQFIEQTTVQYDVILCDLFIGAQSPQFLLKHPFYAQLKKISTSDAVVMVNLQADTDEQLLHALLSIKKYFPYTALIEFDDYSNIIIMASLHLLPTQQTLQKKCAVYPHFEFPSIDKIIKKMRYIPHAND